MAIQSIAEAQERPPDLVERAVEGEDILVSAGAGRSVTVRAMRRERGTMSPERLDRLRRSRVRRLTSGTPGAETVRAMRDEG